MADFLNDRKEGFDSLGKFFRKGSVWNIIIVLLLAGATLMVYNSSYDEWSGMNTLSTNCAQSSDYKSKESVKFWVSTSLSIVAVLGGLAMTVFLSGTRGVQIISISILLTGIVGLLLTMMRQFPFLTGQGTIAVTWILWLALIGAAVAIEFISKNDI